MIDITSNRDSHNNDNNNNDYNNNEMCSVNQLFSPSPSATSSFPFPSSLITLLQTFPAPLGGYFFSPVPVSTGNTPVRSKEKVTNENHRLVWGNKVDVPGKTGVNFIFCKRIKIEMSASVRLLPTKNVFEAKIVFISAGNPSKSPFPTRHDV